MSPATSSDYLGIDVLKSSLRITGDSFNDALQMAITASSRQIDNWYGDQFWTSGQLEQRVIRPATYVDVRPGVFATTTGLLVETDMDGDGIFEITWDTTDWQAEPTVPMAGYPYERIVSVGQLFFPAPKLRSQRMGWGVDYPQEYRDPFWGAARRARVRVTAQFGWPAIPAEVQQACQILAIDHYKSKDLTNGSAGTSGLATGSFGSQRGVQVTQPPFNPLAVKLLCHLKDPVLA